MTVPLLLMAAWGQSAGRGPGLTVDQVLSRVRNAVHYDRIKDHAGGLRITGTVHWQGLPLTTETLFRPDGKYRTRATGPVSWATGFDGQTLWRTNVIGSRERVSLEHRDALLAENRVLTDLWLTPGSGMSIALSSKQQGAGTVALTLRFAGTWEGTLTIDTRTWLPSKLSSLDCGSPADLRITGFGDYLGIRFPTSYATTDFRSTDPWKVVRIEAARKTPVEVFAMPGLPKDTKFDPAAPTRIEVKETAEGALLVHPLIDGQDVGWFMLDSDCGGNVIDKGVADKLKLASIGKATALNGDLAGLRKAKTMRLGPILISDPLVNDADLSKVGLQGGVTIAGVLGFDFFSRAIVEINSGKAEVSLHDPATYKLGSGSWQPIVLHEGIPLAMASFEGNHQGYFRIEPPGSSMLMFGFHAVQAMGLLDGRPVRATSIGGIPVREGVLDDLQALGHKFKGLRALFLMADPPNDDRSGDASIAGTLGANVLENFTLVFDIAHERLGVIERLLPPSS